jgi:hypothetical protein
MQGAVTAENATLVRAGSILTATGIVSAASVRVALGEDDLVFAWGFLCYLALILLAAPRRPLRVVPLVSFVLFATFYLAGTLTANGIDDLGLVLYVGAGALAYLVTAQRYRPLTVAAFALWTPALTLFGAEPIAREVPVAVAIATVLGLLFLTVMLLARGEADDNERIRRIGLGLLAVACVARISDRHAVVATVGGIAPDDLWSLVVVAVLPIVAVVKLRRPVRDALATGVALGAYVLVGLALILGKSYHVDSVVVVHRAAELVLAGQNPYTALDIPEALRQFGLDPALATHLEDGTELRSFNYPALSFLVPAPFLQLGLRDIRYLYLAEIVLLVLLLIRQVRVPWRPLVAAAVVGNAIIARQNVLAGVDPLWAVLTACAFLFIARRTASAVLLGLACAARQPAWFFVPFYVVAVWKRHGRGAALRALGITAVAGLLPNLPFLVAAPAAFVRDVLAPMIAPLEPYGVGLVRFGVDGVLPLLPRGAYGALSALAMVALLVVLWRWWRRLPNGAVAFPAAVLWFGWRSLQNYFSFSAVFALIGDEGLLAGDDQATGMGEGSA